MLEMDREMKRAFPHLKILLKDQQKALNNFDEKKQANFAQLFLEYAVIRNFRGGENRYLKQLKAERLKTSENFETARLRLHLNVDIFM